MVSIGVRHSILGFVVWGLLGTTASFAQERNITVFPNHGKSLHCQVGPETTPVKLEEGMLKLKVGVTGAKGPFEWRVPYRSWREESGSQITLAQAGSSSDAKAIFSIELDPTRLPYDSDNKQVLVRVYDKKGDYTECTTPLALVDAPIHAQVKIPIAPNEAGVR